MISVLPKYTSHGGVPALFWKMETALCMACRSQLLYACSNFEHTTVYPSSQNSSAFFQAVSLRPQLDADFVSSY